MKYVTCLYTEPKRKIFFSECFSFDLIAHNMLIEKDQREVRFVVQMSICTINMLPSNKCYFGLQYTV